MHAQRRSTTTGSTSNPSRREGEGNDEDEGLDTSSQIDHILNEYDNTEGLIKDHELLDPNTLISENRIVGRDEQLRIVAQELAVALTGHNPPNLFLHGPSGTGKSLITNAVAKKLKNRCSEQGISLISIELNCRNVNTLGTAAYTLASLAAEKTNTPLNVPRHGVATREHWDELYRIIDEKTDIVLFVIDELDMLTGRADISKPGYSRLLYELSRAKQNETLDTKITTIAISNDTRVLDKVGSRAISSFSPKTVTFPDYLPNQLAEILKRREDAFIEGALDEDVIPWVSAISAKEHGDARQAIDLLRSAAEIAERDTAIQVNRFHVEQARERVDRNRAIELIEGLSPQKKRFLFATAMVAIEGPDSDRDAARSSLSYELYEKIQKRIGESDTYSKDSYLRVMNELETYSIVEGERTSKGPETGTYKLYYFTVDPTNIANAIVPDLSKIEKESDSDGVLAISDVKKIVSGGLSWRTNYLE